MLLNKNVVISIGLNRYWLLVLCLGYLCVSYWLALEAYTRGYFTVNDIFFDTDPKFSLLKFSEMGQRHILSHPLMGLLALPVKGLAFLLSALGRFENSLQLREYIALLISPLFSSLTLLVFYKTLLLFNLPRASTVLFTLLYAACFSNVVFAIVPESFAISGFLITVLMYYYFRCGSLQQSGSAYYWFLLAILLSGITITNSCIFMLLFSLHLYRHQGQPWLRAVVTGALYASAALLLVVAYYALSQWFFDWPNQADGKITWIKRFMRGSAFEVFGSSVNVFSSAINAFIALSTVVANDVYCAPWRCNGLMFWRNEGDVFWLAFVFVSYVIFVWCSLKPLRQTRWHDLYCVSLLILGFNFLLHSVFGRDLFLYTQHWMTPLCLLLVPILGAKPWALRVIVGLLVYVNVSFFGQVDDWVDLDFGTDELNSGVIAEQAP